MGNYIIEDNIIKLNYLFTTGTDISLDVTTGNKEVKIDSYDSITFENSELNKKISLKKDNDQEINETYQNNRFFNIMNSYYIHNKVNGR